MFRLSCWMGGVCMLYSGMMPMILLQVAGYGSLHFRYKTLACGRDQPDDVSPLCQCPVMSWRGILDLPKPDMLPKFLEFC